MRKYVNIVCLPVSETVPTSLPTYAAWAAQREGL